MKVVPWFKQIPLSHECLDIDENQRRQYKLHLAGFVHAIYISHKVAMATIRFHPHTFGHQVVQHVSM